MTTHESFMLLGCSNEFMDVFRQLVPDLEEQVFTFLDHLRHYKITDGTRYDSWLPGLMKQVYGPEVADRLLQAADLP